MPALAISESTLPMASTDAGERVDHLLLVGHVAADGLDPGADGRPARPGPPRSCPRCGPRSRRRRPALGQRPGHAQPDAPVAPGHDHDPSRQIVMAEGLAPVDRIPLDGAGSGHGPNCLFRSDLASCRPMGEGARSSVRHIGRTDDRHHPGPPAAGPRGPDIVHLDQRELADEVEAPPRARSRRCRRRAGRGRHRLLAGVVLEAGRRDRRIRQRDVGRRRADLRQRPHPAPEA